MGEIRIVGPGKTCGYPYPVCKKVHTHKQKKLLPYKSKSKLSSDVFSTD